MRYAGDTWLKKAWVNWTTMTTLSLELCSADKDYHSKVLSWDNEFNFKSLVIQEIFSKNKDKHILKPEDCPSEL
jgi:protein arginine N-methyltransferase 2